MALRISSRPQRKMHGYRRYSVGFSGGPWVEFIIESPPKPQTREWKALYLRMLADAVEDLHEKLV